MISSGNSSWLAQNLGILFRSRECRLPRFELASTECIDSLLAAQHVLEMFRRSLPNGTSRRRLDRLSNRLTKILSEARKLATP